MNNYNRVDSNLKAIGVYIFGGSQSIAHLQCGWTVDNVLEMTEDMTEYNAYHFTKNYPNIPVLKPSEWNNETCLNELKYKEYDLLFANNPCSGLSLINRNANSKQPINNRFFEVFDVIKYVTPKTFLIENAPTLVTIGTPILKQMVNILGDKYKFTIIRDMAGNHGVPMKRQRTFIVGWRIDIFNNNIPIINTNKETLTTVSDALKGLSGNTANMYLQKDTVLPELQRFYNLVEPKNTVVETLAKKYNLIKDELDESELKMVNTFRSKLMENKRTWNKSACRLDFNSVAPSMTSMAQFIHPTEDRELYIREYARIMGYPDDFIFYPEECKCSTIQCLAQGVPVNFIKYISKEIKRCFINNYKYIEDKNVVFQHHTRNKLYTFNFEEFMNIDNLGSVKENGVKIN